MQWEYGKCPHCKDFKIYKDGNYNTQFMDGLVCYKCGFIFYRPNETKVLINKYVFVLILIGVLGSVASYIVHQTLPLGLILFIAIAATYIIYKS